MAWRQQAAAGRCHVAVGGICCSSDGRCGASGEVARHSDIEAAAIIIESRGGRLDVCGAWIGGNMLAAPQHYA
jgi:hypothetical protein